MTTALPTPPAAGTPRTYRFPHSARVSLDSGTRVVVASLPKLPLVTLTLVFHRAGADADPAGREGLAQLTAAMLLEGSATMDGVQIAERFELLGTSLGATADWDAALVSVTVQPHRLRDAVALVRDVVRAPAFPQHELERLQGEHRANRMHVIAEPRSLADAAFAWCCYDGTSRYRRPVDGTSDTVSAISRDDLHAHWTATYVPNGLTVVLAGDVTTGDGVGLAEDLVRGWPARDPDIGPRAERARHASAHVSLIEKPGAAQTELRIGHIGVPRLHDAFFPLTVMNAIVGGLFSSRINLNLRERHGYTYGAHSGFDWRRGPGPWVTSAAVNSEATAAAIRETLGEIDRIRSEDVALDELTLATSYLTGVFPLRFETTGAVAGALASQATFGLPEDYFDSYRDHIASVTPADVRRAAAGYLHPDQLQIVATGDPGLLRSELDAFGARDVSTYSADEIEAAP